MRLLLIPLLVLSACDSKTTSQPKPQAKAEVATPILDTPIKRDLDRICNAEEQSGALHEAPNARATHVGMWLANNLESQQARDLSAKLVALAPEERIAHLKGVLSEHQLSDCEIIRTW